MTGETTLGLIELFVALVAVAAVIALVVRRVAVPYTVALVLVGLAAPVVTPSLRLEVSPELVLAGLLPGLVFEAALRIDAREFARTFAGVALLAAPGVVLVMAIVAFVLHATTGLPLILGLVVGATVSATDPAAVLATFKQLGSPRRLATLVEGESLFNDGTGLVVFVIALRALSSGDVSAPEALLAFLLTVAGSVAIGGVAGFLASRLVARIDDHLIELSISLVTAYGAYLVADALHESGLIATVVAGMILGTYGRSIGMSRTTQQALDTVWEFAAFLLTALVFLLVGLSVPVASLLGALGPIAWAIAAILIGRAVVVYVLLGGVARFVQRRRIPASWLHVTFWSGLRGAVAVAMALSLPADVPQRTLLQAITYGVVLFTLLVQGTTVEWVIRLTGLGRSPAA